MRHYRDHKQEYVCVIPRLENWHRTIEPSNNKLNNLNDVSDTCGKKTVKAATKFDWLKKIIKH